MYPTLSFDGRCEEAFRYYEKVLGAKIVEFRRWGETPMADRVPKQWAQRVIHAEITWNGQTMGGGDAPPEMYKRPQGFSVTLDVKEPAEAERLFQALSEGGKIEMALAETFWAQRFGMCVDRFGVPWMVNCSKRR